jgi:hypothetical protein
MDVDVHMNMMFGAAFESRRRDVVYLSALVDHLDPFHNVSSGSTGATY